ncbi:Receptor L-domain domain-containing protein [Caenorhabditis elegans]|uniref:Receptor L-domain domain-containing protein n=1 Tax=Caenorhabditis elegans TaxID=6239 RepID=B3GWA5_CAEEL|nr:Receptor L-domain domain-containing protein [Caenorhabditis elegans]CCD67263.1 Receptor L-domain domain-containing protein [Caenorhabditis elegans]|eukprot:NP_001129901.1 Insulin/EGF-Receptor L Domain protein [Caenorhabditis elegans]
MKTFSLSIFCIFLLFILFRYCSSLNLSKALQNVFDSNSCEKKCMFNYTEITSKTIQFFPKCEVVCAIIVIDSRTDLAHEKLEKAFKKMNFLVGGLRIENTKYTSLSFITTRFPNGPFNFSCSDYGLFIKNNSELNEIDVLYRFNMIRREGLKECNFEVENNEKLEIFCYTNYLDHYMNMKIFGNKRDCDGCQFGEVDVYKPNHMDNCDTLVNGLKVFNVTGEGDLSYLSTVKVIKGNIEIRHTTLQNLSFISKLERIKVQNEGIDEQLLINIHDNPNMTRLGLPNFQDIENYWSGIIRVNFENLHPDFCLTLPELNNFFLQSDLSVENLDAKLCEDYGNLEDIVLCIFISMEELPNNCEIIMGNLIIEGGDEDYVTKLRVLEFLFGSLIIQNTTLDSIGFLDSLHYITVLNESSPVAMIISNPNLKYAKMSGIWNILTRGERLAIIQDNHPEFYEPCQLFRIYVGSYVNYREYRSNLTYTGSNCGKRVELQLEDIQSGAQHHLGACVVLIWTLACYFTKNYINVLF